MIATRFHGLPAIHRRRACHESGKMREPEENDAPISTLAAALMLAGG